MAQFLWVNAPAHGVCNACGSSVNDRGFVDMIGEVKIMSPEGDVTGIADVYYCATCLEQASRYVGCASRDEVEKFAYREIELVEELDKTRDEVKSWQERHANLINNLSDDFKQRNAK